MTSKKKKPRTKRARRHDNPIQHAAGKKKSTTMFGNFGNADIVGNVMQFLGVRSLVQFGSCNKGTKDCLAREVKRRKTLFASCKSTVHEVLAAPSHTYEELLLAQNHYKRAVLLVDAELDFLFKLDAPSYKNRLFPKEHKQLAMEKPWGKKFPVLHMIPLCFYLPPPHREFLEPKLTMAQAEHITYHIAELGGSAVGHLMEFFDETNFNERQYAFDPKYPFRKFEHPITNTLKDQLWEEIHRLRGDHPATDTFRYVAKMSLLTAPCLTDIFHYVLHHADMDG